MNKKQGAIGISIICIINQTKSRKFSQLIQIDVHSYKEEEELKAPLYIVPLLFKLMLLVLLKSGYCYLKPKKYLFSYDINVYIMF